MAALYMRHTLCTFFIDFKYIASNIFEEEGKYYKLRSYLHVLEILGIFFWLWNEVIYIHFINWPNAAKCSLLWNLKESGQVSTPFSITFIFWHFKNSNSFHQRIILLSFSLHDKHLIWESHLNNPKEVKESYTSINSFLLIEKYCAFPHPDK